MRPSTAMVLEGLRGLSQDPEALAEVRPLLTLILGAGQEPSGVPLQSTTAAAARLGVHRRTVERMARDGRLPGAVKVGSAWRVPASALPARPEPAPDAVPPAGRSSRRRRRAAETARRTNGSAEGAMDAVITGRMRGTTPRSDPGSAPTPRGPAQRTGDPMYEKNGTAARGATVTPIHGGATR